MFYNNKICFVESSNGNLTNSNADNSSPSDLIYFRSSNFPPINIYKDQNIFVSLRPGAFSTLTECNLIANNFYTMDNKVKDEGLNTPFNDNKIHGNKIEVNNNPVLFKNNIGNNPSEDFDDLFDYPFEDISISLYDRRIPHYRQYVNAYTTQTLSQSISVLGNFEEITGKYVTESVFKGASGYMPPLDARKRSVRITDTYDINNNMEEAFLDEEIPNNSAQSGLIRRNFSYETILVNGEERVVLSVDESSFSVVSVLTKTAMYYNEENILIKPFNDSHSEDEMFETTIITSRGVDKDASTQEKNTIGRLGEID